VTAFVAPYEETLRELGAECLHSFKARVGFFHAGDIGDVFDRFKGIMGERVRSGGLVCASLFMKP
jgi:hypothetical protein